MTSQQTIHTPTTGVNALTQRERVVLGEIGDNITLEGWPMPSLTTSRIAPGRGCSMGSPRMFALAPMASITGTGILPGAAHVVIRRPDGSGYTPARTTSTCRRCWSVVASPRC